MKCEHCGKETRCETCEGSLSSTVSCPVKKGAIWVQVVDHKSGGVRGIKAKIATQTKPSDPDGLAPFDPLDDDTYQVDLEPLAPPVSDKFVLPDTPPRPVSVKVNAGSISLLQFKLVPKLLELTQVDPHFAPGEETLVAEYTISGLAEAEVKLRILDAKGEILFERSLTSTEKENGEKKTIEWDPGEQKVDNDKHPRHEKLPDPLHGPYRIELFCTDELQSDLAFNVLYHSVQIEAMPWADVFKAATGKEASSDPGGTDGDGLMWIQCKLNELGFWAGPVDADNKEEVAKATARFKLAHHDLSGWAKDEPPYEEETVGARTDVKLGARFEKLKAIDSDLRKTLGDGGTKASYERKAFDPAIATDDPVLKPDADRRVFVESHRFFVSSSKEYEKQDQPKTKTQVEAEWLTRPHVPLRARVMIKNKAGKPVDAAEAVGAVVVRWSWRDEAEADVRAADKRLAPELPKKSTAEPSTTADYIDRALTVAKTGKYHGCPADCGGILSGVDAKDAAVAFAQCKTKEDTLTFKPSANGVDVPAHTEDKTDAVGSSLVYLATSTVAGDNYKVTAKIQFEPSQDAIEKAHGEEILATTGRFVVWRRARIAAYVGWPRRTKEVGDTLDLSEGWKQVAAEFAMSMFELDVSDITECVAKDILDSNKLQAHWNANKEDIKNRHDELKDHVFTETSIFGDPEALKDAPPFDDVANAALRIEGIAQDLGIWPPTANVKAEVYNLLVAIDSYKESGESNVKSVGDTLQPIFKNCFKDLDSHRNAGKLPTTMPGTLHTEETFDAGTVTKLAVSTDPIKVPELEELLVTKGARAELDAYTQSTATTPSDGPHTGWVKTAAGRARGAAQKVEYIAMLVEELAKVLAPDGVHLKPAIDKPLRKNALLVRKWHINRRAAAPLDATKNRFAEMFELHIRKKLAADKKPTDGVVVLDYQCNDPVTIDGEPYLADGVAFGGQNGTVLLDEGLKSRFYSLSAHELGHCLFLQHWVNAGSEANKPDHDQDDDNCIMSYPFGGLAQDHGNGETQEAVQSARFHGFYSVGKHYCYDAFKPHFCGKCSLVVRGWNTRSGNMPMHADAGAPTVTGQQTQDLKLRLIAGTVDDTTQGTALASAGINFYPIDETGEPAGTYKPSEITLPKFPTGHGYNADAARDPNAFRVEVIDKAAYTGSSEVEAKLEALMPQLSRDGKITGHGEFPPRDREKRSLTVKCQKVAGVPNAFRSKYIRVVTDDKDKEALPEQTILVSDVANGSGGLEDNIEILDQKIRMIYQPGTGNPIQTEIEIGRAGWLPKKRVKLAFHIECADDPDEQAKQERIVRHRTMHWVRSVFAQANLAPKIVSVDFLSPDPVYNMLSVMGYDASTLQPIPKPEGEQKTNTSKSTVDIEFGIVLDVKLTSGMEEANVLEAVRLAMDDKGLNPTKSESKQIEIKDENDKQVSPQVSHDDNRYPAHAISTTGGRVVPNAEGAKPSGTATQGGGSQVTLVLNKEVKVAMTKNMECDKIAEAISNALEAEKLDLSVATTTEDVNQLVATHGGGKKLTVEIRDSNDKTLRLKTSEGTIEVLAGPAGETKTDTSPSEVVVALRAGIMWKPVQTLEIAEGTDAATLLGQIKRKLESLDRQVACTVSSGNKYLLEITRSSEPVKVEVEHDDSDLPKNAVTVADGKIKVEPATTKPAGGSNILIKAPAIIHAELEADMNAGQIADAIESSVNAKTSDLGFKATSAGLDSIACDLPLVSVASSDSQLTQQVVDVSKQDFRRSKDSLPGPAADGTLSLTFAANLSVELAKDRDHADIAEDIKQAADAFGLGISAATAKAPQPDADLGTARDVYFFIDDKPLAIRSVTTNDKALAPAALMIAGSMRHDAEDRLAGGGSASQRFLLRRPESWADDRIDVYVIPEARLPGRAYAPYTEKDGQYKPDGARDGTGRLRNAAWVAVKQGSSTCFSEDVDERPFTLPHELIHVLADTAHTQMKGCIMNGDAKGTATNTPAADKHIYSAPVLVDSLSMGTTWKEATGQEPLKNRSQTQGDVGQDMADDMHNRGGATVTEGW